jgi:hypothetical protein
MYIFGISQDVDEENSLPKVALVILKYPNISIKSIRQRPTVGFRIKVYRLHDNKSTHAASKSAKPNSITNITAIL